MSTLVRVVRQHYEEAHTLYGIRDRAKEAPQFQLFHLGRLDDRISAHFDGLVVAGKDGWGICGEGLSDGSRNSLFVAGALALEARVSTAFDAILQEAAASPSLASGLTDALGWVSAGKLQGVATTLLRDADPSRVRFGVAACSHHRVNPGAVIQTGLDSGDAPLRAEALKCSGQLGLRELLTGLVAALGDEADAECRFWGAWSSVLLGDRNSALRVLGGRALADGPRTWNALTLTVQAAAGKAHTFLSALANDPSRQRWLIHGSGVAGDPKYIPWLVEHMRDDETARIAGEALCLITGVDLDGDQLYREQPEDFHSGPTDNPDDDNVEMDPDEGLPWPDVKKIEDWWMRNRDRFTPGQRYFMGAPVTKEHCIHVLKHGYQRQRILAAQYLCLLQPGTPLFNTSAPAWRQQRLLAQM